MEVTATIRSVRGLCLSLALLAAPALALAEEKAPTAAEVAKLIEQLGDDDIKVRDEAGRRLVKLGDRARGALAAAATKHTDLEGRKRARLLLGRITAAKVEGLIKALGGNKAEARAAAEKDLLALLEGKGHPGEGEAARAALLRASEEHADRAVRDRASGVLARLYDEQVRELIRGLSADQFATREKATQGLLAIGKPALKRLREAAEDSDPETRARAAALIKKIAQAGK